MASFSDLSLSELEGKSLDVKSNHSGKAVHSKVLNLVRLVVTNIQDVAVLLFTVFLDSISEPSLGVASKFIGVLSFQDLLADSQRRFHGWIVVDQLFLKFLVFLLGIPVPLVNLLELKPGVLGQLLELQL